MSTSIFLPPSETIGAASLALIGQTDSLSKRHAINKAMLDELQHALDAVEEDQTVRVLVVIGAGANFSSGFDLQEQMERRPVGVGIAPVDPRRVPIEAVGLGLADAEIGEDGLRSVRLERRHLVGSQLAGGRPVVGVIVRLSFTSFGDPLKCETRSEGAPRILNVQLRSVQRAKCSQRVASPRGNAMLRRHSDRRN